MIRDKRVRDSESQLYFLMIRLNAYEDLKTKENKNHIFNFYNLLKINGVFRTCSHNSVHSNFLDYHKQPGTLYAYFT